MNSLCALLPATGFLDRSSFSHLFSPLGAPDSFFPFTQLNDPTAECRGSGTAGFYHPD